MKPPYKTCPKCGPEDALWETQSKDSEQVVLRCLTDGCDHEEPLPPLIINPNCDRCKGTGEQLFVGSWTPHIGVEVPPAPLMMECYQCRADMPTILPNVHVDSTQSAP